MVSLEREQIVPLGLALFCVLAIALAAGTLSSTVMQEGGNGFDVSVGEGNLSDLGDSSGEIDRNGTGGGGGPKNSATLDLSTCVRPLNSGLGMVGYFLTAGFAFYLVSRRFTRSFAMISAYVAAPFIVMVYFLTTTCAEADANGGDGPRITEMIGDASGGGLLDTPEISPVVLVGIFGLMMVGAVLLFFSASGDEDEFALEESDEDMSPSTEEFGLAAKRAADRLEQHNVDADNEVYRAWVEMTRFLNVPDFSSSTPGEFAEAAIDAGINKKYVEELTRLFEEVRYGEKEAGSDREERAIEVFRSIEEEYASVEPNGDADVNSGDSQ